MNTRALVGGLVLAALAIFGVTLYYSLSDKNSEEVYQAPEEEATGFVPDVIDARHQFKDGAHTIVGQVDMPTSCDLLEADAVAEVREPDADRVVVQFTHVNEAESCAQVITPARFKVKASGGEDAEITATWNGKPIRINIIEVGPNEDIDDFEVYFKG